MMLEKIIEFNPGYDKRDPNPNKNYGIHGMQIRFLLKGEKGATQFLLFTDWYPAHTQEEFFYRPRGSFYRPQPTGADVGYHSPVPQYEGQETIHDACEYLDGSPCYYDGSGLAADALALEFLEHGDKVVWQRLEDRYIQLFGER